MLISAHCLHTQARLGEHACLSNGDAARPPHSLSTRSAPPGHPLPRPRRASDPRRPRRRRAPPPRTSTPACIAPRGELLVVAVHARALAARAQRGARAAAALAAAAPPRELACERGERGRGRERGWRSTAPIARAPASHSTWSARAAQRTRRTRPASAPRPRRRRRRRTLPTRGPSRASTRAAVARRRAARRRSPSRASPPREVEPLFDVGAEVVELGVRRLRAVLDQPERASALLVVAVVGGRRAPRRGGLTFMLACVEEVDEHRAVPRGRRGRAARRRATRPRARPRRRAAEPAELEQRRREVEQARGPRRAAPPGGSPSRAAPPARARAAAPRTPCARACSSRRRPSRRAGSRGPTCGRAGGRGESGERGARESESQE